MHGTMKPSARKNWRLRKTLARHVEVRVMSPDDIRFLWATYKKGALTPMDARFADAGMTPEQFSEAFDEIAGRYNEGWTISAETKRGFMPVGMIFGALAPLSAYMIVAGVLWFPWATKRNVVEGAVAFFNEARHHIPMMLYATEEHKRMYEVCCMHGIMRRIGTSEVVFPGRSAAVYETRAKK
jgi:hypothetical protein